MSVDLLCFSHLRWGFVYQRPNHLMSRWARNHRVFFIEEPVFDAEAAPRLEVRELEPGLRIVTPHLSERMAEARVETALADLMTELVTTFSVRAPLLWFYTPMALGHARHLERSKVVYDCMDELTGFDGASPRLEALERELFGIADIVFTGGQSLYEAKRSRHSNVHAFPSSVDAAHFARAREPRVEEPADQATIPHPRLGFFGVIDERLDLTMLREGAELRPDLQFVIVGPVVKIQESDLPRQPNIHYLGAKSYEALPAYVAGWDVAIMPFALNAATRFISPTKTLEYLAAGKPVISTPIHDVVDPYGDRGFVRIVENAEELVTAADDALSEIRGVAGAARLALCDAYVARTSWDRTWYRMRALVLPAARAHADLERIEPEAPCSTI